MDDLGVVQQYGAQHGDEYAAVKFDNAGPVMVVISFTGHIEDHRAALVTLVKHPDRLRVDLACHTQIDLQALRDQIMNIVETKSGHVFRSLGSNPDKGWVSLSLSASSEALAKSIKDKYGDAVSITVGNWPYPYSTTISGESFPPDFMCPMSIDRAVALGQRFGSNQANPTGTVAGLSMVTVIEQQPSERGGEFKGHVTFSNGGTGPVTVDDHAIFAFVLDHNHQVIEAYSGSQTADGRWHTLKPGESHDVALIGDTGTCVPNTGYTLAAGDYGVAVAPLITEGAGGVGGPTPSARNTRVVSPEATLTVH